MSRVNFLTLVVLLAVTMVALACRTRVSATPALSPAAPVETIVTSVPENPTQPITEPVSTSVSQITVTPVLIPSEYQDLYTSLEKQLNGFHDYLNANWDGSKTNVIYAAELITANGNRGEALLTKESKYSNRLFLDRLQEMGLTGVGIQIAYPLLEPSFPRSSEYL
jgi:hypothetical protein